MALQANPVFQPEYQISYEILTQYLSDKKRTVDVYASPEEIQQLAEEGYLVRERLFTGDSLEQLRTAIDKLTEDELAGKDVTASRQFGGLFIRYLMDKHELFLDLLKFQPLLSIARAVLGPLVQIRGLSARIAFPDRANQETQWHIHQQVVPKPLPPFFSYPHGLDCLIYLDDLNDATGPVAVLPGSHLHTQDFIASDDYAHRPDQVTIRVPAGSCVIIHSNVWHRGMPAAEPNAGRRRLLLMTYVPTWMRKAPYGEKPANALTDQLLEQNEDTETRELLGAGGYT